MHVGVIRNTNFTKEGALDDSDIAYLDVEAKKLEKRSLQFGDVILEKSGGGPKQPVGRVILFDKTEGVFSFSNFTAALRVRDPQSLDFRFLHKFLHWTYVSGITEGMQSHSTGIRNLDGDAYKAIKINFPPLPEQQRIVTLLDEAFDGIATARANAEQNLQNARAIFESQLEAVFAGETQAEVRKPLGSVCDLQNGYAFKSGDYIDNSNTLNIRMSGIRPGGTFDPEHNQRFLPDSYAQEYANFLLNDGDLIIAMTDMAGDPKILGVPTLVSNRNGRNFLMNQRVGKLFGFSDEVRVPYLRYFLSSPTVKLYYKNKGAGGLQINISKGDILSAQIPIRSHENQDRVVELLDSMAEECQRLESIYQRKLAALDDLKKSLLHQAFSGQL